MGPTQVPFKLLLRSGSQIMWRLCVCPLRRACLLPTILPFSWLPVPLFFNTRCSGDLSLECKSSRLCLPVCGSLPYHISVPSIVSWLLYIYGFIRSFLQSLACSHCCLLCKELSFWCAMGGDKLRMFLLHYLGPSCYNCCIHRWYILCLLSQ